MQPTPAGGFSLLRQRSHVHCATAATFYIYPLSSRITSSRSGDSPSSPETWAVGLCPFRRPSPTDPRGTDEAVRGRAGCRLATLAHVLEDRAGDAQTLHSKCSNRLDRGSSFFQPPTCCRQARSQVPGEQHSKPRARLGGDALSPGPDG